MHRTGRLIWKKNCGQVEPRLTEIDATRHIPLEEYLYHMELGRQGFSYIPYLYLIAPMLQLNLEWSKMKNGLPLSGNP